MRRMRGGCEPGICCVHALQSTSHTKFSTFSEHRKTPHWRAKEVFGTHGNRGVLGHVSAPITHTTTLTAPNPTADAPDG